MAERCTCLSLLEDLRRLGGGGLGEVETRILLQRLFQSLRASVRSGEFRERERESECGGRMQATGRPLRVNKRPVLGLGISLGDNVP